MQPACFYDDSVLVLSPDLVGPSKTRNSGIIGEGVDLDLEHLGDMRPSTLLFHLHLLVEIKGYRREDAKEKKSAMDTYPNKDNCG